MKAVLINHMSKVKVSPRVCVHLLTMVTASLTRMHEVQPLISTGLRDVHSGAPTRAKRACDRAPYSWNMVNLFPFGCHVIDRAYVRTYASTDCKGRVGETIKRKGGVSQACLGKSTSCIWTFTKWSTDSCQNRIATDQYHMTISRAHVSTHRRDVFFWKLSADQLIA